MTVKVNRIHPTDEVAVDIFSMGRKSTLTKVPASTL